jgi:Ca-activated chloride channel homolog
MKVIVIALLLISLTDPGKINTINTLKSEAKKAYHAADYKTAVDKYRFLTDSLLVKEDELSLNLANAYFNLNDTASAASSYQALGSSTDNTIRSVANQQLGILKNKQGKFEEALSHFKQAIKADPANKDARYNYEMLKKKLEEKKKQDQQKQEQNKNEQQQDQQQQDKKDQEKKDDQQKKDQEKKDEKKSDNKDEQSKKEEQKKDEQKKQEQKDTEKPSEEKKETPPSTSEKLQQMKISEEKAKMLLEAMKNQEQQYLQQNKRKATKPKDKGKPDW